MEKIRPERRSTLAQDPVEAPSIDEVLSEPENGALETASSAGASGLASVGEEPLGVQDPSLSPCDVVGFSSVVSARPNPKPQARLVALDAQDPAGAEFAVLAARLNRLKSQGPLKRVLVAACKGGGGGSLVCANLALTLAQNPTHKVLLLDGDLEQPCLTERFGLPATEGFAEYLQGTEPLEALVRYLSPGGIWFLPAGKPPHDPENRLRLLRSRRLPNLLGRELDWFDWVIVDSPPLETRVTAGAFMQFCEGLLIVIRKGHTTKKLLRRTLDMLDGAPVLGYALNEMEP